VRGRRQAKAAATNLGGPQTVRAAKVSHGFGSVDR
jgi:hypothetical protein